MKQKFILLIFLFFIGLTLSAQTLHYVKQGGTGDGSSWANASGDLQALINAAAAGDQVWVAAGTYKPNRKANALATVTAENRENAFVLKEGVKVFGGFAGTEITLSQRNLIIAANRSILSGDLDGNDDLTDGISTRINGNNAYHVVMGVGITNATELDGFTITGGNANDNSVISINDKYIRHGDGGGMAFNSSSPLLTHLVISGNIADYRGGGINNVSSSPLMTNVTISGNIAENDGGGMRNTSASPVLINVTISGNVARGGGGGISNYFSQSRLTNVVISGNTANANGGGIENSQSSPVLTNVTISRNTAGDGGGIRNANVSSPKHRNSIIWGNTLSDGTAVNNISNNNSTPDYQNSLVQGSGGSGAWVTAFGQNNGNNLDADPRFVDAGNRDYRLRANSPVINKGSSSFYTAGQTPDLSSITTDLAGNIRIQKGAIDIGAYESPYNLAPMSDANGIIYVKQNGAGDFTGSNWANAAPELADALIAAKTNTGIKQIWVAGGTYKPLYSPEDGANFGTNQGRDNTFLLVDGVKLYGSFAGTETALAQRNLKIAANRSILSGDLDSNDDLTDGITNTINGNNAYHVVISAGISDDAELNGFTITGGNADDKSANIMVNGKSMYRYGGGGMLNESSSPIFAHLTIIGNTATEGGGIANINCLFPVFSNTIISANTATESGGGGILNISSSPSLINNTISGNKANEGGGIYNTLSSPVLRSVAIIANTAVTGGAMYQYKSSPKLINATISGNTATDGGAMYNLSFSSPEIMNSIIYGNNSGVVSLSASNPSIKYSLVQDMSADAANNNLEGSIDPMFLNPLPPGLISGGDYGLQANSPVINKGSNSFFAVGQTPDFSAVTTDLAGKNRIQRGAADLGAYESSYSSSIIPDANGIVHVKENGAGDLSGNSWVNAAPELADALKEAKTGVGVKQIWVAKGTYKPLYTAEDGADFATDRPRDNAFVLVEGVKIYGGFAGTETTLAQRDLSIAANRSILSGDLDNNDDLTDGISTTINGSNAYHVVIGSEITNATELNGFTITGGDANDRAVSTTVNGKVLERSAGGGIINSSSSLILSNTTISGNIANEGGGMYNDSSSPMITNTLISGNTAQSGGGGIANLSSSPLLTNVTISGNACTHLNGGGISNSSSFPVLTNVVISGNTANYEGGGMYNLSSSPVLTNVTISGNLSTAIFNLSSSFPTVRNSIIYGNEKGIGNSNSMPSIANSLVQDIAADATNNNLEGSMNPMFLNPLALGLNMGGDYRLQAGSPLINKGGNSYFAAGKVPDLSAIVTDLDGKARIQKGAADIGAYESVYSSGIIPDANGIVYVKENGAGDLSGNSWVNAAPELADALKEAKMGAGIKQIWVAKGTYKPLYSPEDGANFGTDRGRDNTFLLVDGVKIYGGFAGTETTLAQRDLSIMANRSILSGDLDNNDGLADGISTTINGSNAYHVLIATEITNATELNGFTITGGKADDESGNSSAISGRLLDRSRGGGLVNESSYPLIENVIIAGNTASLGGGIYIESSSPTLSNLSIKGNIATSNGGGISSFFSFPLLNNVIISGNTAVNDGGGMYNFGSAPILTNVTISGNAAVQGGGGLHNDNLSDVKIRNSIIYGNSTNIANQNDAIAGLTYSLVQGIAADVANNTLDGSTDPKFINPLLPGFSIAGDYRLQTSSPLVDKGSNSFYANTENPDLSVIITDLDGNARLVGQNVDLGAYEMQALPQTITAININKTYGETSFAPGATASSGLQVSYVSADNTIAEAYQDDADNKIWKLKIKKAGKVNITASQAGNSGYIAADNVVFELDINRKPVTLSVKPGARVSKSYDGNTQGNILASDLELATGDVINNDIVSVFLSSGSISFTDASVGTGKTVELGLGDIQLTGAGAGNYVISNTAPISANVGEISKASQTISFPAFAKVNTRAAAFEPGATVNTGLPLTYSSSNTAVAEVYQDQSANNHWKIRIIGEGEAIITASQQGNANYESASLSRTLTVEPVTLPVSLVSYQAKRDGNRVQLSWTTSSEKDNAYFEIQRSLDGFAFQRLTTLATKGNSDAVQNYSVYDLNPANGANYYRLVQFDINGEREVLGDRVVNVSIVSPVSVQVFPNPAAEEINLSFIGITAKDINVTITDLSGRKMHQEIIRLTAGKTSYKLALANKLVAGQYVINVVGEGLRSAIKLVVLD